MNSDRVVLNFSPGPCKLPAEVLKQVQSELLQYENTQVSVMELNCMSKEIAEIIQNCQQLVRDLLTVPDNYKVLFLQGGAIGCCAAVAMNLMGRTGEADYLVTGNWSAKAAKEAAKYGKVNLVYPPPEHYRDIADRAQWTQSPNASYLYYCANETIDGLEFPFVPETDVPIVTDMSSSIMTRAVDVSKFGVIFGGAQKNIGPAGVTVAIVRDDLIGHAMKICPSILDFKNIADNNSVHNTPVTFSLYVMGRVLQWIQRNGGVDEMNKRSIAKSKLLYRTIDASDGFYHCPVVAPVRSRMNVIFRISGSNGRCATDLEETFVQEAERRNIFNLQGHSLVGGLRASLYNGVLYSDVELLVKFMEEFQELHMNNP